MRISEAANRQTQVGGTIDAWCTKCKLVLAHTIEAMMGDRPARVHCNTCKAQHGYKAQPPSQPRVGKSQKISRENLLKNTTIAARAYSPAERYAPGDVIQHAVFGRGVATMVKDAAKVEVLFESGRKLLIHAAS